MQDDTPRKNLDAQNVSDEVKARNKPSGTHYVEPSPLGIEPVEQTGDDFTLAVGIACGRLVLRHVRPAVAEQALHGQRDARVPVLAIRSRQAKQSNQPDRQPQASCGVPPHGRTRLVRAETKRRWKTR